MSNTTILYGAQQTGNSETVMEIHDDTIKVVLRNIGEGWCGDYNENDPDDEELLRFDVYIMTEGYVSEDFDGWEEMEDSSYCTQIPACTPRDVLEEKIKIIFERYRDMVVDYRLGTSVKKLGEELSWLAA